jgi:hypothetical protein
MVESCTCIVTNKWWKEDSKKGVAKNFTLRVIYSLYNVLVTAKEYTVLLAGLLGVALILLAAWLDVTAGIQEQKARQPLIDFDIFIDDVIYSLNYVTTEFPNEALSWVNDSYNSIEDTSNSLLGTATVFMESSINKGTTGTQQGVNEAVAWGYRQNPANSGNPPQVTIAAVSIPRLRMPATWRPQIPVLDLSAARIPDRGFSADKELYPFIQQIFNIPRLIAYYVRIAGAILLAYAGIRLLFALLSPFLPRPDCLWCCGVSCAKITKVTSKSVANFFTTLLKPWVHVPLIFGICLILLVVLFLNPNITILQEQMKIPLVEADKATSEFISKINEYIVKIPKEAVDWLNSQLALGMAAIRTQVYPRMMTVLLEVNKVLAFGIQRPLNQFLVTLDASLGRVDIPLFTINENYLVVPEAFIPPIPPIPTEELLIPLDLVSLQKPISPWVDDRIEEMRDIANEILLVGIWLVIIPGIFLVWAMAKACIPHGVNDFFLRPDFYEATGKNKDAKDEEMN